ncbi:hypothetical protein GS8_162 [Geobacillus stearothermophilus]|uniref:Mobile element protein n=1 Tax=Geobacillus stearothermophilus TaxID=1422 RepID=A0ABQ7HKJ0_GEOSE|nr:hypothetical protein GS8_162 [Geobacillus stearothermophilus]
MTFASANAAEVFFMTLAFCLVFKELDLYFNDDSYYIITDGR